VSWERSVQGRRVGEAHLPAMLFQTDLSESVTMVKIMVLIKVIIKIQNPKHRGSCTLTAYCTVLRSGDIWEILLVTNSSQSVQFLVMLYLDIPFPPRLLVVRRIFLHFMFSLSDIVLGRYKARRMNIKQSYKAEYWLSTCTLIAEFLEHLTCTLQLPATICTNLLNLFH